LSDAGDLGKKNQAGNEGKKKDRREGVGISAYSDFSKEGEKKRKSGITIRDQKAWRRKFLKRKSKCGTKGRQRFGRRRRPERRRGTNVTKRRENDVLRGG